MESDKALKEKRKNPRASANIFSALTFSWTLPLFWHGRSKDLEIDDLFLPLNEHKSSNLGNEFETAWNAEVLNAHSKKREPSLLRVIIRVFGCKIMALGIPLFLVEIVLRVAQPLILGELIAYFTSGEERTVEKEWAYIYAGGVVLCSALSVFLVHPYMMGILHIGMKLRVAACSLVYRKALRLSKTALGQTTIGQLVNLLSNDVNRFDISFIFLHNLWIGPLQTLLCTVFLWRLIDSAALVGVMTLLLLIPLQAWLGKKASSLRLKTALRTDERVRLMNEIISGIQVIKMYTWEKPFARLVSTARRKEINVITKSSYIRGVMLSFIIFHTRTSIFCSILAYVLFQDTTITAKKVFVVTSFYNTLRQTMTVFFPQGITQVAECLVSIKRLKAFLLYEERHISEDVSKTMSDEKPLTKDDEAYGDRSGITLADVSANWNSEKTNENTLTDINFSVIPSRLTAIIGPVGSGKTSLLHVILKELPISSGKLDVIGKVSYASQEPWLFAGSVRQNILFGEVYDKSRYKTVVKVCALKRDFELLPYGDKTLIGDRGVSLSGGQRARINLARAVYKKADIYLLDDPLSAVDTHVGKHLFEDCVTGFLKDKTVVLITHQLQYLHHVDHIVMMENGSKTAEGTFSELQKLGLDFTNFLVNQEAEEESKITYSRQSSLQSVASSHDGSVAQGDDPVEVAEAMTKGTVKASIYGKYMSAGGHICVLLLLFLLLILAQALASAGDYWIAFWVNLEERVYGQEWSGNENKYWIVPSREVCVYVFSGLTVATIIITLIRSFLFFNLCMRSSMTLHNKMFDSITRATMYFFNTNSSGRILNRFSKDMGAIDELLPASLMDVLQIGFTLLAIITVVAAMNPWLLVPTGIAAVIFYILRIFYLSTSRSLKRLEGVTKSPVFAHLKASIQGLTTIRAFKAQQILQHEFDNHQDLHSSAWYLFIASSRAFGLWLDMVCLVYIALVTFSFLVLDTGSFAGDVGLAITQSIGLTGMFQWGMRQSAELENQMTSVERVLEYSDLKSEPELEAPPEKKPKASWPEFGAITFQNVFLRYSDTDPWVLKNLNFSILPKQKIGIVGRTGAGKSSLIAALFRLTETDGSIVIDEVDVSTIGIHDLRSKISIIPQEPVLFSGSMRYNLDPFSQYSDDVLWNALEEVELKDVIKDMPGGLTSSVSEGGSNLSVGQRQLVCLARAIVRDNKILLLDEATANVDPHTDSLIQRTIRKKFANCTVLTIAHRLNTVMDSHKVLVMDAGSLVEFDHPHLLLQNEYGFLTKMVENSGSANAAVLKDVALNSYKALLERNQAIAEEDESP